MKSRLLYIATFSFFCGVFAASTIASSRASCLLIVSIGCSLACASLVFRPNGAPIYRGGLFQLGLIIIFVGAGMLRMSMSDDADRLARHAGKNAEFTAIVSSEPEMKDVTQRFVASLSSADGIEVSGDVLIIGNRYPEYEYGDEIKLRGKLVLPENFETYAGGPVFDYVSYLYKDGIRYTMYRPKAEKVAAGKGSPVISALYSMKRSFADSVEGVMSEPESSLLLGLLAGDKSSLGQDILEDFRRAGLSHIIVLSGYNVTVVAESLMRAFSYLSVAASPLLGAGSIILFALMTGASATTVRASIMALLFIFSKRISRRYDVSRALVFAAFLMVLENPRVLAFDVSFQLSVLATIAIIYVAPLVRKRLSFVPERFMFRDVIAATIGTQLFVLPYILHVMGILSVVSIVSNVLVLPVVPLAMFSGFIAGFVGLFSPLFATPLGWASDIVLAYVLKVTHISAALPFAAINISLPLPATILLYLIFGIALFRIYKRRPSDTDGRLEVSLG